MPGAGISHLGEKTCKLSTVHSRHPSCTCLLCSYEVNLSATLVFPSSFCLVFYSQFVRFHWIFSARVLGSLGT
jgi:hypothetical protein